MYEISNLVNMRGAFGLHVTKYPAGTYGFCGNVPLSLAYEGPAEDIEKGRKFGFGLVKTVRRLSWPTAEAAWETAEAAGYARCASPGCSCNSCLLTWRPSLGVSVEASNQGEPGCTPMKPISMPLRDWRSRGLKTPRTKLV